jgi:hypothetical protein
MNLEAKQQVEDYEEKKCPVVDRMQEKAQHYCLRVGKN